MLIAYGRKKLLFNKERITVSLGLSGDMLRSD